MATPDALTDLIDSYMDLSVWCPSSLLVAWLVWTAFR
jgi:hypothetical protein